MVLAGCLAPGQVDVDYGGPTGIAMDCNAPHLDSANVAARVGGETLITCRYPVPATSPQRWGLRVLAFEQDGAPDLDFGDDGVVDLPHSAASDWIGYVGGLARSGDGAVWVSAPISTGSFRLYRLLPDGTLDTAFGAPTTPGYVNLGGLLHTARIAATNDGVSVVAQDYISCSGCGAGEGLRVRRFSSSGPTGAWVTAPLNHLLDPVPEGAEEARVVLNPMAVGSNLDGSVIVAGSLFTRYVVDGSNESGQQDLGVVRIGGTGLDPTYGTGGVARVDVGFDDEGTPGVGLGQSVQPSAAAVAHGEVSFTVGGAFHAGRMVGRLDPSGALDATFSDDGLAQLANTTEPWQALAVDGKRRVVLSVDSGLNAALVRVTAAGEVDAGFGTGGRAELPDVTQLSHVQVAIPLARYHVLMYRQSSAPGPGLHLVRVGH
jgi:hypothetical protein